MIFPDMESRPKLRITALNAVARIELIGNSDTQEWKNVWYFWRTFSIDADEQSHLAVSLRDFFPRRSWFKGNWIELGLEIETDANLAKALEAVQKEIELFEALSSQTYTYDNALVDEGLGLIRPLTKQQKINLASMIRVPNGANFSVPGAGKTSTQLALFSYLSEREIVNKMLVVAPKSAFEAWIQEPLAIFQNPPQTEVYDDGPINPSSQLVLVNFEKLESTKRLDKLAGWASANKTLLVIDEAHRIKGGSNSVRWKACTKLAGVSSRVDILTGTPMPQSYADLRNLFSVSWKSVPRPYFSDEALSRLEPGGIFVRTTKGQLGLPPIEIHPINISMGPIQSEIYRALGKNYVGQLSLKSHDQLTLAKKGRAVMTLLAGASNPALISSASREELIAGMHWPPRDLENADLMAALLSYMSHEIPAKYEWVAKYLAKAASSNKKTLVWSSFVGNLVLLEKFLKPFNPAVVHGAVNKEDRIEQIHKFRHDSTCTVLLTNPQTLGEGISLHQDAHEAIFIDRTYNAAQYLQALDRIHRLGLAQHQVTNVYLLECSSSIDERVRIRLEAKIKKLSEMLDDPGLISVSLPQADELGSIDEFLGLDEVDLSDLLAHLTS